MNLNCNLYAKYFNFVVAHITKRNMATVKRFYRKTNIIYNGNKYEVTLDQRKLKTPKGRIFEVNSKPLALAVAAEWDSQKEIIDRGNMHLTALCNTILDDPHNHSKVEMVNYIVNCLDTDTVLFHSSDATDELYKLQTQKWDPLIQWFCDRYQVDIVKTQSIKPPVVPPSTKAVLTRHLLSFDYNAVYGFLYGTDALKSVILTTAAVDRALSIEEAVQLSRLEEEFQTSHWGKVEWSHGLSKEDLQARLSAAVLFVHLNSYSTLTRPKQEVTNTT